MAELPELIKKLYPSNHRKVMEALANCWKDGVLESGQEEGWQQEMQLYVTYADSFCKEGKCGFDALTEKLSHVRDLGCNSIHVLPFLMSPMIDGGFDISDYYLIRDELGGNGAFERFLKRAKSMGMNVLMDMVFNHISDQHRWFRLASSGDLFYRNFFVHSDSKPKLVKKFTDEKGVWGRYELADKEVDIRVIFPEQAGEIPHWRKAEDGYWYYHTFYPQQADLDWNNHNVFVAFSKVMVYWAKKGVSFRLDAIPFVGKNVKEGQIESSERTHLIVQALNQVLKRVAPKAVFLLEVNQPVYVLKKYFGDEGGGEGKKNWWKKGKSGRVVEAELAYNFPLMSAMWRALLNKNADNMWTCLFQEEKLPEWAGWVTFLRNHDELSLEFSSVEERKEIMKGLVSRGAKFRDGFGVSGRTASFLDFDERRIVMAYMFLASMPGSPAIIYGDEIGKGNDFEYMHERTRAKRLMTGSETIVDDTREIGRGWIGIAELQTERSKSMYKRVSEVFRARLKVKGLATALPKRVESKSKAVFVAKYKLGGKTLVVAINLGEEGEEVRSKGLGAVVLAINGAEVKKDKILLPAYGGVWVWKRSVRSVKDTRGTKS